MNDCHPKRGWVGGSRRITGELGLVAAGLVKTKKLTMSSRFSERHCFKGVR